MKRVNKVVKTFSQHHVQNLDVKVVKQKNS